MQAEYAAKLQVLLEFGEGIFTDLIGGLAYGLDRSDNEGGRGLTRK